MKKLLYWGLLVGALGCQTQPPTETTPQGPPVADWPRGITYEVFVRAFADSDGDGIGDLPGLTMQLDYLADLGVQALWLMPVSPSPSYHKYDVVDYYGIDPEYGTKEDFRAFVDAAHQRGLRVVIDLVLNHSSAQHPWFQEARQSPQSSLRPYYVWADDSTIARLGETKEGSADSEGTVQWHNSTIGDERYYGYFSRNMPDLNYDHPAVRREVYKIGRYWLEEMGVDGFRLDAARHIYPEAEAKKSHAFWVEFREEMRRVKPDVYLVGEVWDEDTDVVAPYLEGLPALFNFALGYRMVDAVRQERDNGLLGELLRIRSAYQEANAAFVDATFLTNHDQTRVASELDGHPGRLRTAANLLLTLPGAPYLYYGEELGMPGRKPDPQIREPFLWTADTTQSPYARWITPRHALPDQVRSLAEQRDDTTSLYHHYRRLIAWHRQSAALTGGATTPEIAPDERLLAFRRAVPGEELLVMHNLSGASLPYQAGPDATLRHTTHPEATTGTLAPYSLTIWEVPPARTRATERSDR